MNSYGLRTSTLKYKQTQLSSINVDLTQEHTSTCQLLRYRDFPGAGRLSNRIIRSFTRIIASLNNSDQQALASVKDV